MAEDHALAAAALKYVQECAPVLALSLDAQRRIATANAEAHRVLGEELIGRPFSAWVIDFAGGADFHALPTPAEATRRLTLATAAGMPETYCFRFFPLAAGTLALGSLDAQEREHLGHEVLGLNRELNNLTRQLHQTNAELQELSRLKSEFLAMAAHDLRRPISTILTCGRLLFDETRDKLAPENREFLKICLEAAADMKRLVDIFLELSLVESGRLQLHLAPVNAQQVVASVGRFGQVMAASKEVTLLFSHEEPERLIAVDLSRLQQVLLNLVANAIEQSRPGQRVWVSARWVPAGLQVTVRDEGPGLNPQERAHLFDLPIRPDPGRASSAQHAGLGLVIARKIVGAHHGSLVVESAPGCGATFVLTLPSPPPPAGAVPSPHST